MKTFEFVPVVVALTILAAATVAVGVPIASSTFDTGDEGWRLGTTLDYDGPVSWLATGGNPGGFIYGQDPDTGAFGFKAPAKFLGPVSDAYGHELTFDIASYQTPEGPSSWVGMRGVNGLELICLYDTPTYVYPAWNSRAVTMTENAGWVRVSDGQPPTYNQFMSVLNNLGGLIIMAEFVDGFGDDISGLDNVVLAPEPATLAMLAVAAALLGRRRRGPDT